MGSHRYYTSALPNEIIFLDSAYCPVDSKGFSKCLIIVDQATAKVTAYPSKNLLATTVQKHLYTYMITVGVPRVVCTDLGTEFKKGLDEQLAEIGSSLESVSPTIKGTTSQAECSIRLLKRALVNLCLNKPEEFFNFSAPCIVEPQGAFFYSDLINAKK